MVRGGGVCWWASGRKQYITMEVISRKGIQYIHLYTAISREEFFQYMFILYYCISRYIYIPPPPTPSPPHLYFPHLLYTVRSACKLRARRTEYKSVFFHTT